jgi:hypothetical protein
MQGHASAVNGSETPVLERMLTIMSALNLVNLSHGRARP